MPERDSVFVCSAYGCRTQTEFKFTSADIATLQIYDVGFEHGHPGG